MRSGGLKLYGDRVLAGLIGDEGAVGGAMAGVLQDDIVDGVSRHSSKEKHTGSLNNS